MKFRPRAIRALAALLMLGLLSPIGALPAQETGGQVDEAAFRSITSRLMCQCGGCSYLVLGCNHINCSSATYISKTVREALAQGRTEEMILASLADQYGPRVLAEPPREGFTWLGWIMPYVALLLGGGAVAFVLWRWKAGSEESEVEQAEADEPVAAAPPQQQASVLVEKYRDEIDRELARD